MYLNILNMHLKCLNIYNSLFRTYVFKGRKLAVPKMLFWNIGTVFIRKCKMITEILGKYIRLRMC